MKKRRLLSIVLSLCMVLALMPQMVFADTYENFEYSVTGDDESGYEVTITKYTGDATALTIPSTIDSKTVTAIGESAFSFCTSIKSVTIPEGVTSIEKNAFFGCTSLESVTIPNGVTSIGGAAFKNCTSLESITVPDSVTSIGAEAFYNCTTLKNVTIPEDVTYIGPFAFYYCTSLKSVTIPKGVTRILDSAFARCTSLESVTFEDYSQLTEIGDVAFADCTSLKRVILPNGVTRILDSAFARCTSLESVEVPSSVSYTDWGVFNKCTSLESIFLPNNVDASDAEIPDTASQVRYSLDNDKVTITEIELGTDKTSVAIPETICGYPVVAVAASEQSKVGEHTCRGGTATCTEEGLCSICGEKYNNPDNHTGSEVWEQYETQHKQYWDCCKAVVIDYENHTWNNGVCSVCDYICEHKDTDKDLECDFCGEKLSQQSGGTSDDSNNGSKPAAEESAKTGDDTNLALWLALMLLSGAGIGGTTLYTRRKRTNE